MKKLIQQFENHTNKESFLQDLTKRTENDRETCFSLLEDTRREHPRESQRCLCKETCRGNADYRIHGIPHSTIQKRETNRKESVKRLVQQFENHPNRDSSIQDLNRTEEFNPFSEESKELITDMGNTEILEFYETSSKIQCLDCALCWEDGIVCCIQRRGIDSLARKDPKSCQFLATSSKKKNPTHGARHGPSVRQCMYCKAHDMLEKARKHKKVGIVELFWKDGTRMTNTASLCQILVD